MKINNNHLLVKYSSCEVSTTTTCSLFDIENIVKEQIEDDSVTISIPDHEVLNSISKSKKYHMLGIGQPNVKRLLRQYFKKEGDQLVNLLWRLLNLISSYYCMLRYLGSTCKFSWVYCSTYDEALNIFLQAYKNCSDDTITVQIYKIERSHTFSHIIIVSIKGIDSMAFYGDLELDNKLIAHNNIILDYDPLNYYSIIEKTIMTRYGDLIYLRASQMASNRKSRFDKLYVKNLLYKNNKAGLEESLKDIELKKFEATEAISLLEIFERRLSVNKPGTCLPELTVGTNKQFVCISIKLDDYMEADRFLLDIHNKFCACPWYLWSESTDMEETCYVLFYRPSLELEDQEYEAYESYLLSVIAYTYINYGGSIYSCVNEKICIESFYTPAFGPMLINEEFKPSSSLYCRILETGDDFIKEIVKSGQLIREVLISKNREDLLCYGNQQYNDNDSCDDNNMFDLNDILGEIDIEDKDTRLLNISQEVENKSEKYNFTLETVLGYGNESESQNFRNESISCHEKIEIHEEFCNTLVSNGFSYNRPHSYDIDYSNVMAMTINRSRLLISRVQIENIFGFINTFIHRTKIESLETYINNGKSPPYAIFRIGFVALTVAGKKPQPSKRQKPGEVYLHARFDERCNKLTYKY